MVCLKLWNWVVLFWALVFCVSNLSSLHVLSLKLFQGPGLHTLTASPPGGLPPGLGIVVGAWWTVAGSLSPVPPSLCFLHGRPGPEANTGLAPRKHQGVRDEDERGARGRGGTRPSSHPHSHSDLPESAKPSRIIGAQQDLWEPKCPLSLSSSWLSAPREYSN